MSARRRRPALALAAAAIVLWAAVAPALGQSPPPPTVGPDGQPSPFPTELSTPSDPSELPGIEGSALLADLATGQVLVAVEEDERRPVASLTKLMTAYVVEGSVALEEEVEVSELAASQVGSGAELVAGERLTVEDLLHALIVTSANDAAVALAEHVSGSVTAFVDQMNAQAEAMGLDDTRFASPHGLDDAGFSTAGDMFTLVRSVFRRPAASPAGVAVMAAAEMFHDLPAPPGGGGVRRLQNRNVLLWLYPGAIGVKTGFTTGAGYSVAALARREGRSLVAVVLGGRDEVFSEAAALLDHGFMAWEERTLVEAGEGFGTIEVGGLDVPVVAGAGLVRLRPVGEVTELERDVRLGGDPVPPGSPPGTRVGHAVVRVGGTALGRVPLVLGEAVSPAPSPEVGVGEDRRAVPPWWWVAAAAALLSPFLLLGAIRTLRRRRP